MFLGRLGRSGVVLGEIAMGKECLVSIYLSITTG